MHAYIYICLCVCVSTYIYIYIYTQVYIYIRIIYIYIYILCTCVYVHHLVDLIDRWAVQAILCCHVCYYYCHCPYSYHYCQTIVVIILGIVIAIIVESILARSFISLSPYRSVSLSLSLSMAICPDLVMYLSNRLNVLSLGCLSSGSSTHQVPTRL